MYSGSRADLSSREVSRDALESGHLQGSISQNFLITINRNKATEENQEVGSKIKNYFLTEIQIFLKDFMQQEGGEELPGLCGVLFNWLGTVSEPLPMAAKMCPPAGIS